LHLVEHAKNDNNDSLLRYNMTEVLHSVLSCKFSNVYDIWLNTSADDPTTTKRWKGRTFCFKFGESSSCRARNISDIEEDCASYANTATKIILVSYLSKLRQLMKDGVRVLQLIRDPRGSSMSVYSLYYGKSHNRTYLEQEYPKHRPHAKSIIRNTCTELRYDLALLNGQYITKQELQVHRLVRYEDLVFHPYKQIEKIYTFLGETPTAELLTWVESWYSRSQGRAKMTSREENPYDIYRNNATATAIDWRSRMPWQFVQDVQARCSPVMTMLGYRVFTTENEMLNMRMSAVQDIPDPELFRTVKPR